MLSFRVPRAEKEDLPHLILEIPGGEERNGWHTLVYESRNNENTADEDLPECVQEANQQQWIYGAQLANAGAAAFDVCKPRSEDMRIVFQLALKRRDARDLFKRSLHEAVVFHNTSFA